MGRQITEISAVIGYHFYQPKRQGDHDLFRLISTDPLGQDWNGIAIEKCYRRLAQGEGLQTASFDTYATLRREIAVKNPETHRIMIEAMKANGIGDSFSHNILPDMSYQDKRILIGAGKEQYKRDVGNIPQAFWAAESAYDTETLEVLADFNYAAFICAPEQIMQADGEQSDNRPTRIMLPSGRSIIALPFDRPVSSALGWDSDGRKNADEFTDKHIVPAIRRAQQRSHMRGDQVPNVLLAYTDGETFGLHDEYGDKFAIYLTNIALPEHGITPVSINDFVNLVTSGKISLPEGQLKERTAWSCSHGLDRWHKGCACIGDKDGSWKTPFYNANKRLNDRITTILDRELPDSEAFLIHAFDTLLANPGGSKSTRDASLLSAKVSALTGRTSCGTFFDNPWTSGYINIMFGLQAIQHLREAGFTEADRLLHNFLQDLSDVVFDGKSARQVAESMLTGDK